MPFKSIMREDVVIFDENGNKLAEAKASVQKDKIFLEDKSGVAIREGFTIERTLPNGEIEKYRALECHFRAKFNSIPAGYEIEVEKHGKKKKTDSAVTFSNFLVTGGVNQIVANSNNTTMNMHCAGYTTQLKDAINNSTLSPEEKQEANEIIESVEEDISSGNYKKSVVRALLKSLPALDNITSISNSLLSAL